MTTEIATRASNQVQMSQAKYLGQFRVKQCVDFASGGVNGCRLHKPFGCFSFHFRAQRRRRVSMERDRERGENYYSYSPHVYCLKYSLETGQCSDGDSCKYLHHNAGDTERKFHPRFYKTSICHYPMAATGGQNPKDSGKDLHKCRLEKERGHCPYAHGPQELRSAVVDTLEEREVACCLSSPDASFPSALDKERNEANEDPRWRDRDYILRNYKSQPCKRSSSGGGGGGSSVSRGACRQGFACPLFHNTKDRRRSPFVYSYRHTPCATVKGGGGGKSGAGGGDGGEWSEPSVCKEGDQCGFCHTRVEQQFHPDIYKTTKCHDFQQTGGRCPRGVYCAFSHQENTGVNVNNVGSGGVTLASASGSTFDASAGGAADVSGKLGSKRNSVGDWWNREQREKDQNNNEEASGSEVGRSIGVQAASVGTGIGGGQVSGSTEGSRSSKTAQSLQKGCYSQVLRRHPVQQAMEQNVPQNNPSVDFSAVAKGGVATRVGQAGMEEHKGSSLVGSGSFELDGRGGDCSGIGLRAEQISLQPDDNSLLPGVECLGNNSPTRVVKTTAAVQQPRKQTGGNPWFGHALFSSSRSTPSPPSVPGGGASGSGGVPIASPSLRHNTAVATSHERERERLSSGGSFSWLGDPPSGGQQETGIGGLGGGGAVNLIVGSPHFYDSPLFGGGAVGGTGAAMPSENRTGASFSGEVDLFGDKSSSVEMSMMFEDSNSYSHNPNTRLFEDGRTVYDQKSLSNMNSNRMFMERLNSYNNSNSLFSAGFAPPPSTQDAAGRMNSRLSDSVNSASSTSASGASSWNMQSPSSSANQAQSHHLSGGDFMGPMGMVHTKLASQPVNIPRLSPLAALSPTLSPRNCSDPTMSSLAGLEDDDHPEDARVFHHNFHYPFSSSHPLDSSEPPPINYGSGGSESGLSGGVHNSRRDSPYYQAKANNTVPSGGASHGIVGGVGGTRSAVGGSSPSPLSQPSQSPSPLSVSHPSSFDGGTNHSHSVSHEDLSRSAGGDQMMLINNPNTQLQGSAHYFDPMGAVGKLGALHVHTSSTSSHRLSYPPSAASASLMTSPTGQGAGGSLGGWGWGGGGVEGGEFGHESSGGQLLCPIVESEMESLSLDQLQEMRIILADDIKKIEQAISRRQLVGKRTQTQQANTEEEKQQGRQSENNPPGLEAEEGGGGGGDAISQQLQPQEMGVCSSKDEEASRNGGD